MLDIEGSDSTTAGFFTPQHETGSQMLVVAHGNLEHTFSIPTSLYARARRLREAFAHTLTKSAAETDETDGPSSTIELVAKYLRFVADGIEQDPDSGLERLLLKLLVQQFEQTYLHKNEIHAVVAGLPDDVRKLPIIRSYYGALAVLEQPISVVESALMRAALEGDVRVFVTFGGQGNTENYLDELREVYTTYRPLTKRFMTIATYHLQQLSRSTGASSSFAQGLDVMRWLEDPETEPDVGYLISAPVSFPLIGLAQLVHYLVTSSVLGLHPGHVRARLSGTTGHSQGVVTAAAIAASTDWESFEVQARKALTILFWIGVRSQEAYPLPSLPPSVVEDSREQDEGVPTPSLSVRGLPRATLDRYIQTTNRHLTSDRHVAVSLVNSSKNFVVTGPPTALYGLNLQLRKIKPPMNGDANEARTPFSQRKTHFITQFLPITAPFHSAYLTGAIEALQHDLRETRIFAKELGIPVYSTFTGHDIRNEIEKNANIVPDLVRMICKDPVHWEKAVAMPGATHILDFGPGGISGVGGLTSRSKDGTGVRVILATSTMSPTNTEVGYKHEIFARRAADVQYAPNWAEEYSPKLVRTADGRKFVETKMSKLLGLPPVLVAGMTPSTVPWDFVAATMSAGYEIELAGGGYHNAEGLTEAISKIEKNIPAGRGIVLNIIYASPKTTAWQIPLIRNLCALGVPLKGITIGAGVPSLDVANEYIRTLGLRQISFKPGSLAAIQQVITIAKANPDFPVIMQWTGGRGGGHHSYEDAHQPILSTYGKIRHCSNIILVAGSGFGSADDTYPYLNGTWSTNYGYPPMPFDGVLFGSRCMVAKEAHTSKAAKQAIVDAKGLEDHEWEKTYQGPAGGGGIVTVRSEMGEPIHKLATRGVMLWAEMDKKMFSLPKEKMAAELKKKETRDYVIRRLNADFQKPWFGRTVSGKAAELSEMTYGEVARRMVELMFIKHQSRWIHHSLSKLTGDFLRHVEQRFAAGSAQTDTSIIRTYSDLDSPFPTLEKVLATYPQANTQLMNAQDCAHFLTLCKRAGQKPVPFVPCLDESFEVWFKKDSLWQSEDLDAVVDQDVGRVCILHGPVAARFATTTEESIKDILDGVHNGHIEMLKRDVYHGDEKKIPFVESFGGVNAGNPEADAGILEGVTTSESNKEISYFIPGGSGIPLPGQDEWFQMLAGSRASWRRTFLTASSFVQGQRLQPNPTHRLLAPTQGMLVEISYPNVPEQTVITVKEAIRDEHLPTLQIGPISGNVIPMNLIEHRTASGKPVVLPLRFTYHPEAGYAPIQEDLASRNERIRVFYYKIWFGEDPAVPLDMPATSRFDGGIDTVSGAAIRDFARSIGNAADAYIERPGREVLAPMDFGIVAGWRALLKPLLYSIDADLLKLVHLSNRFRMIPGASPFKKGDTLSTTSDITAVINQESGKMVEVCATISRQDGKPAMEVTSQFFYRGTYADFENTFQRQEEKPFKVTLQTPKDVAVLKSKKWFKLEQADTELMGHSLVFKLRSLTKFSDKTVFSSVETTGTVELQLSSTNIVQVASVDYLATGPSRGNPVLDYLRRVGTELDQPVYFENPIPIKGSEGSSMTLKTPASNENYAVVSGDYNPVHVSRVFSEYVNLPGTITHGMYTSGAVRSLVETWVAENHAERMRDFDVSFTGMVLPGDLLEVRLQHVGMSAGCKVVKIEAVKADGTEEKVLAGEAIVEQAPSAYIFTGQGSQEQGMGMDLYEKSAVARDIWDRADKHFTKTFGISILNIVRNNPKELTVYFGGARGKAIRQNYTAMVCQSMDGASKTERIFRDITDATGSYTFRSPSGLLSATQFTQPALTLMQMAAFEDLRARGVIQPDSVFAGHSLGEYSALSSIVEIMPVETLVSVVFYRGLCMQIAVERDEAGRSDYSMCAVNPSRIGRDFSEDLLKYAVGVIVETSGCFLEIVNYNVANMQYVCAGDLRGLDILAGVMDTIKARASGGADVDVASLAAADNRQRLVDIVEAAARLTDAKPRPLELARGVATIPLRGIDVPFHSSYLRSGVESFRSFLLDKFEKSRIDPAKLVGKYVPNVTARPFELTREFFEYVLEMTQSPRVGKILEDWEKYQV